MLPVDSTRETLNELKVGFPTIKLTIIVIEGFTIRQDEDGRYCLNNLHKATGGKKTDQPSDFLKNTKTQALLTELCSEDSRIIKP